MGTFSQPDFIGVPGNMGITKIVQDYTDNKQSMVKTEVVPLMGTFSQPDFMGANDISIKYPTDDFRELAPVKMIKVNTVPMQADFTPLPFNGTNSNAGTIIVGIRTISQYEGIVSGSTDTEVRYIYRTVGSPRRAPLESSWLNSKNREQIIIDEVDGDVDE